MNKEHSLEEDIRHGTQERPITAIHFQTGPDTFYPDCFHVQRHWHHSIELLKIRKGVYTAELNLESFTLYEGDLCFVNSGELHKLDSEKSGAVHEVIIFNPHILEFAYHDDCQDNFIAPLLSHLNSLPHVIRPECHGYAEIAEVFDQTVEEIQKQEEGWYFGAKIHLLKLMHCLDRNRFIIPSASIQSAVEKDKIDRYKRIASFIMDNYMRKITLEQLAALVQCNPHYLCRFFKEIAGVSPIRYLIDYRLEQAQDMLKNSTKTVLEVSLDCGFENVSYFIRQFRRVKGITPREYRKDVEKF